MNPDSVLEWVKQKTAVETTLVSLIAVGLPFGCTRIYHQTEYTIVAYFIQLLVDIAAAILGLHAGYLQ